jgi:hypothetical protein
MTDILVAAKMDVSSRPEVTPCGIDLILEGRIEYQDDPADEG